MSEKYRNKYRIKSARLPNYDYGSNGMYFITICTKNRNHYFGTVIDDEMQLTEIGKLAFKFWAEIPKHFPFIHLGEFIIMPNHTHGILIIDKPIEKLNNELPVTETLQCKVSTRQCKVSTRQCKISKGNININDNKKEFMSEISPKPGSISTIIRSYKSAVTKHARKIDPDFGWQSRFHDHIIRDNRAFQNISNYIKNNPTKWGEDKFKSKE